MRGYIVTGELVEITVSVESFTLNVAPKSDAYDIVIAGRDAMLPMLQSCSVPIPVPVGARTFVTFTSNVVDAEHVAVTSVPVPHVFSASSVSVVVVTPVCLPKCPCRSTWSPFPANMYSSLPESRCKSFPDRRLQGQDWRELQR